MHLYRVHSDGTDVQIVPETVGGNLVNQAHSARARAWADMGKPSRGQARFTADAKVMPDQVDLVRRFLRGDAQANDLPAILKTIGAVNARSAQYLAEPFARTMAAKLIDQHGHAQAARMVADASTEAGIRADASILSGPGAIAHNLTLWAYRRFTGPRPVLNYRSVFAMDEGLDPYNMSVQILYSLRTGEARFFSGAEGGDHQIGQLQFKETRLDVNNLIASSTVNFIDLGRQGLMGIDGLASMRQGCDDAMELAHGRLSFLGSTDAPKVFGFKNWPGIYAMSTGYGLAAATAEQILNVMNRAVRRPTEASQQKYTVKRLVVAMKVWTRITLPAPSASGDRRSVLKVFQDNNPGIEVVEANELDGLFGSGTYAMVGLPADPLVGPTYLRSPNMVIPVWTDGLSVQMHVVSATAGMYCESPVGITVYTFTA